MALTTVGDVVVDQTAYNLATDFPFRAENFFDRFCEVKPTAQAHNGATVKFHMNTDMAVVTTPLDESTDVTPATLGDTHITVTLAEFGNAAKTTALVRGTSYLVPYDPIVANLIGYNMGVSIDTIARAEFYSGSNVRYAGNATARNRITPNDKFRSANVRRAVAELRAASVPTFGGSYVGFIHPDVSYDFREETGNAAWVDPHAYSSPEAIWNGEIGKFAGVRFIETPRALVVADAGSSTTLTDVYGTLIIGRQAVAKAWSMSDGNGPNPRVIPGPVTDTLRRFVPLGWYHLVGYGIYREESLRRIESASSIGAN